MFKSITKVQRRIIYYILCLCCILGAFIIGINIHQRHIQKQININNQRIQYIKRQDTSMMKSLHFNKHTRTIYLTLPKSQKVNIKQGYKLFYDNLELNRETQINKDIHITTPLSIHDSQILSHFNDKLASLNHQQSVIKPVRLRVNSIQIRKALYLRKHASAKHHKLTHKQKISSLQILHKQLPTTLFTSHINVLRQSSIIDVNIQPRIAKEADLNISNNNYILRTRLYKIVYIDMLKLQAKTKNPFIIIKINNIY